MLLAAVGCGSSPAKPTAQPTAQPDARRIAEHVAATGGTVVHQVGIAGRGHGLRLLRRHAEARGLLAEAVAAC